MTRDFFDRDRLDRFFDGDMDASEERRMLSDARRVDGAFEELAKTRRAIELLHDPVEAPDMTQSILGQVHARRAFLPPRWRRMVSAGRLAAAVALLTGIGAVAMVQRHWPEATSFTHEARLISAVVQSGQSEASLGVRRLVADLGGIAALAPVFAEIYTGDCTLRLGDGGSAPGTLCVAFGPERASVESSRPKRLAAVGLASGLAWEVPADIVDRGMGGVFHAGAMPFEVFEGAATIRVWPASYPMGSWVVAEEFIVADNDEPRSERD